MSEKALPRPAWRISPSDFYIDYVPLLWKALVGNTQAPWPAWTLELQVIIEEKQFTVVYEQGKVRGIAAGAMSPLVTIACSREAWRQSIGRGLNLLLERAEAQLDALRAQMAKGPGDADLARLEALRQLPGAVQVQYTDDAGDAYDYTVSIGDGNGPKASVALRDGDVEGILDAAKGGKLTSLLRSKLAVHGDAGYVVRLAQLGAP